MRHNAPVPRVPDLAVETPVNVHAATVALGSDLRLHLLRHFRNHPGSQKVAAEALGLNRNVVSLNTRALIEVGVVVEDPAEDGRSRTYRINEERLRAIVAETLRFALDED